MKLLVNLLLFFCLSYFGVGPAFAKVKYHCPADSAKVINLISKAKGIDNYGERIAIVAKNLKGTPFARAADNNKEGTIVVRLDSLNQRELIYLSMAIAKTANLTVASLKEFEKNLEDISRKKGKDEGFPSQFLYGSDWIVDNVYRGNLKEMTEYLEGGSYRTKTLDYVTRHPEEFPAMADSVVKEKVKIVEFGFRSHRIPHLKKQSIGNKNVKELMKPGDIIIMSPIEGDFDIYDIGIVTMENSEPVLIHIPRDKAEVVVDPFPISRRFKIDGQHFYGYRWLRPIE